MNDKSFDHLWKTKDLTLSAKRPHYFYYVTGESSMHVSVSSSIDRLSSDTRESIRRLLGGTLARLASRISQVSVLVVDENGPRGGVDKVCRVNLMMPGFGPVTATAKHEKVMAAVSEASRRARRVVLTKLKRRGSLRERGCARLSRMNDPTTEFTGM